MKGGGKKLEAMDDPRGFDPELEKLVGTARIPWSEHETELIKRYYGKVPNKALVEKLGRTLNSITAKAYSMGIMGMGGNKTI
jgi:hypothetical protein